MGNLKKFAPIAFVTAFGIIFNIAFSTNSFSWELKPELNFLGIASDNISGSSAGQEESGSLFVLSAGFKLSEQNSENKFNLQGNGKMEKIYQDNFTTQDGYGFYAEWERSISRGWDFLLSANSYLMTTETNADEIIRGLNREKRTGINMIIDRQKPANFNWEWATQWQDFDRVGVEKFKTYTNTLTGLKRWGVKKTGYLETSGSGSFTQRNEPNDEWVEYNIIIKQIFLTDRQTQYEISLRWNGSRTQEEVNPDDEKFNIVAMEFLRKQTLGRKSDLLLELGAESQKRNDESNNIEPKGKFAFSSRLWKNFEYYIEAIDGARFYRDSDERPLWAQTRRITAKTNWKISQTADLSMSFDFIQDSFLPGTEGALPGQSRDDNHYLYRSELGKKFSSSLDINLGVVVEEIRSNINEADYKANRVELKASKTF